MNAKVVAAKLKKKIFIWVGVLREILMDQGTNLLSEMIQQLS